MVVSRHGHVGRVFVALCLACVVVLGVAPSGHAQQPFCSLRATITGTGGDDVLIGTRGPDVIKGHAGDDVIRGRGGDDVICGDDGADTLEGQTGDDWIDGGAGVDQLHGGPGSDLLDGGAGIDTLKQRPGGDVLVDAPGTLSAIIDAQQRDELRPWASTRTIATINNEVSQLTPGRLDAIPAIVLATNAQGDARERLLQSMRAVLATFELGFYVEIWSYTTIELTPGGFFATCNRVWLDPAAFTGLDAAAARNVLMHESFHSFNCVNGGPVGALDEGAAIWIFKAFFAEGVTPAQTWAEATYGTKLWYRDIAGQPAYPLQIAENPTPKLIDVYRMLAARDPSRLPWNSQERLTTCYQRYFEELNRNVDFSAVWLPAVEQATNAMLADADCRPA